MENKIIIGILVFLLFAFGSTYIILNNSKLNKDISGQVTKSTEVYQSEVELSDTEKEYNETNKEVIIKTRAEEDVARIKLITPLNNIVHRGYGKVAEFNLSANSFEFGGLDTMKFYDKKESMKEINREFDYKYKAYENKTYDIIENVCTGINGTKDFSCNYEKVGERTELKEVWKNLNQSYLESKKGLTIGVFTDVKKGDKIEWIPTFFGTRIDEWAGWTESLNSQLIIYYAFEEESGAIIDSTGTFNATATGVTYGATGKVGNCLDFESGDTEDIVVSDDNQGRTGNHALTVNIWAKAEAHSNNVMVMMGDWVTSKGSIFLSMLATDYIWAGIFGGGQVYQDSGVTFDGEWHMYTYVYDGVNKISVYIDGSHLNDATETLNLQDSPVHIGARPSDQWYDGLLDEFGYWDRNLSSDEISDLWNDGNGTTYEPSEESLIISISSTTHTSNSSTNETQNEFFGVSFNVTCLSGTCGTINVSLDPTTTEYTPTTRTICNGRRCIKTIYSGVRNVYEDGQWKDIKEARSLKGSGIECVVNYDGENIAECLDWNITHKTIKVKAKNKIGVDIPIKNYQISYDFDTHEKIMTKNKESKVNFNSINDEEFLTIESGFGDELHFGESSTSIKLQDNETENLNDAQVHEGSILRNYGADTDLGTGNFIGADELRSTYIMFNISTINAESIEDSFIGLYSTNNGYESNDQPDLWLWELNNDTWVEGNMSDAICDPWEACDYGIRYYERPSEIGDLLDTDADSLNGEEGWMTLDATSWMSERNGNDTISFYLNSTLISGQQDFFILASKEYTTDTSLRPYLNVTYTEAEAEAETKNGLVNTTEGATPFYTNSTNPLTTSSLSEGQSEIITFWVNATGSLNTNHTFYAYANVTSDQTISNITDLFYIYIAEEGEEPAGDCWTESGKVEIPPGCTFYKAPEEDLIGVPN